MAREDHRRGTIKYYVVKTFYGYICASTRNKFHIPKQRDRDGLAEVVEFPKFPGDQTACVINRVERIIASVLGFRVPIKSRSSLAATGEIVEEMRALCDPINGPTQIGAWAVLQIGKQLNGFELTACNPDPVPFPICLRGTLACYSS